MDLGKRLHAASCILNTQASFGNQYTSVALTNAALLIDSSIEEANIANIAPSTPSKWALWEYIKDLAAEVTFLALPEIKEQKAKVFLLCDKGAKKGNNAYFLKILCWWSQTDKIVKMFGINTDDANGKSVNGAMALDPSL